MEHYFTVRDSHTRLCSALAFNTSKREIVVGYEDGTIKGFDMDRGMETDENGKISYTQYPPEKDKAHNGMVNCLLYWPESKLMLSGGNDGVIAAWTPNGYCFGRVRLYQAVYCLAINPRKRQLLVGLSSAMRVYEMEQNESNRFVREPAIHEARDHDDILKCICCYEGRVYTGSYDGYICVYESTIVTTAKVSNPNNLVLRTTSSRDNKANIGKSRHRKSVIASHSTTSLSGNFIRAPPLEKIEKKRAHSAGILAMQVIRDNEGNVWIFTGSFDKSLKIWNRDIKIEHEIVGFPGSVTGITYVSKTKSLWALGGSSQVNAYEPKSGENISEYISATALKGDDTASLDTDEFSMLHLLAACPEFGCVFASTLDKDIIGWKYQPEACLTCVRSRFPLETVTFTSKSPILIFTGDQRGLLFKWERMEINQYMYTKEELRVSESERKEKTKRRTNADTATSRSDMESMQKNELSSDQHTENTPSSDLKSSRATSRSKSQIIKRSRSARSKSQNRQSVTSLDGDKSMASALNPDGKPADARIGVTKLVYVEELDYVVAASEDSHIYVYGFDPDASRALADLQRNASQNEHFEVEKMSVKRYLDFIQVSDKEGKAIDVPEAVVNAESMSVTNRVAGYTCLSILSEHVDCVTSLAIVPHSNGFGSTYMISGGWDRTICIWNLEQFLLTYVETAKIVENDFQKSGGVVSDCVITSLEYCPKWKMFAYGSSDGNAYVHNFSNRWREVKMVYPLTGHTAEVTCIKWNFVTEKWVTSSEDGTIKIWNDRGECVQSLFCNDPVATLCIDQINGCIVAGVDKVVRVYDALDYKLLQTNLGHTDQIRSIMHLPEPRNQYVSVGWDRTMRLWNTVRISPKNRQLLALRLQADEENKNENLNDNSSRTPDPFAPQKIDTEAALTS